MVVATSTLSVFVALFSRSSLRGLIVPISRVGVRMPVSIFISVSVSILITVLVVALTALPAFVAGL